MILLFFRDDICSDNLFYFVELQAQLCLGAESAEAAFKELEQSLGNLVRDPSVASLSPLGDALTMLLLLWVSHNEAVLQSALASPAVYPVLAAVILGCNRHQQAVDFTVGSGAESFPYSLLGALRIVLTTNSQSPTSLMTMPLPKCLSANYLAAQLVLHGRIPAAAELVWRALARPAQLYSANSGVLCLLDALREEVKLTDRNDAVLRHHRVAVEILETFIC